ncbi:MAG: hypothetical protein AAF223_22310, partial [Bacteroidota bacterium]
YKTLVMNKLTALALLLMMSDIALAQRLEEQTIPWKFGQEITLNLKYAQEIQIKTWDKPEVSLQVRISINNDELNDSWSSMTTTTDDRIQVSSDIDFPDGNYCGDCSGRNYSTNNRSMCSQIEYSIFVPSSAALQVETLSGNMTIQGVTSPLYAKSLSGFVDVDWLAQQGATVSMKSTTGEVYTNLDLLIDESDSEKNRRSPVGWEIEATAAGGGSKVELESISNDVYFRQAKPS